MDRDIIYPLEIVCFLPAIYAQPAICMESTIKDERNNENENIIEYTEVARCSKPVKIDYRREIENRILKINKLNYNWDGYGGVIPDENAINNSIKFIDNIPESLLKDLKDDNITPTPYGTIVYDWEKRGEIVSVEIGTNKIGFFTEFKNNENYNLEAEIFNEYALPESLNKAFQVLYRQ
jgi:hypothetical protein